MKPPEAMVVAGVNTRTGDMLAPATPPEVMEVKVIPVVPSSMAVNVPTVLVSMTVSVESVVAAAIVGFAA